MTRKHFSSSGPLLGIITAALIWVATSAAPADALVAAGTQISNQATVTFAEGVAPPSNTVNITVNLVAAAPTLTFVEFPAHTAAGDTSPLDSPETTNVDINYRLVSNSNGPDTYEFLPAPSSVNVDASVPTLPPIGSITLGSTLTDVGATVPANTTTVLNVMTDSNTADGIVNGIAPGNFVYYNGGVAEVAAGGVDETTNAYTTITLLTALPSAPGQGEIISEAIDFTYTVVTGTMVDPATPSSHAITVNVRSTTDTAQTAVQNPDPATINLVRATLGIVKYVRNATDATSNPATPEDANDGTNSYWLSGVTGDPDPDGAGPLVGDTLEYLLVVTNSGTAPATNVVVSDTITGYLSFTAGSVDIDTDGNGTFDIVNAEGSGEAVFAGQTLTVYAGSGAVPPTGGSVAAGATSTVRFQTVIQ